MFVHKTAIIEGQVDLADSVHIGPYCMIQGKVKIGEDTRLDSHVVIEGKTSIGRGNHVFPHVALGTAPQDLRYDNEETQLDIGDNNTIREYVLINRGTPHGGGLTKIGNENLFMAYSHIAHDCRIGNSNIFSNVATLAGHVEVQDHATIGGLTAFHQFTRMGSYSFVGGCSAVSQDVIPYGFVVGNRAALMGINKIGLRRHGFSHDMINRLNQSVKILICGRYNISQALEVIEQKWGGHNEIDYLVSFIRSAKKRGICRIRA